MLKLEAYDGQEMLGNQWVFNNNEGEIGESTWRRRQGGAESHLAYPQSITHPILHDNGAEFIAVLRRNYQISRIDQTEMGNTSIGVVATAVQGNDTTISAPATKTVSGKTLYFAGWSDGVVTNPRTVTPTDHTTYTALYKGSQLATSVASNSKPNQQKIVQTANGWLHRTYERTGPDLPSLQRQLHPLPSANKFNGSAADFRTESGYRLERVERVHHRLGKSDRPSVRQIQDPHQSG
jgi:hypothetical protein